MILSAVPCQHMVTGSARSMGVVSPVETTAELPRAASDVTHSRSPVPASPPAPLSSDLVLFLRVQPCGFLNPI